MCRLPSPPGGQQKGHHPEVLQMSGLNKGVLSSTRKTPERKDEAAEEQNAPKGPEVTGDGDGIGKPKTMPEKRRNSTKGGTHSEKRGKCHEAREMDKQLTLPAMFQEGRGSAR
ncbi:hypothetical protein NDU88_003178 [Pleurodeles waltl]|uniref:Uncharacterized protein n=1 Tax=Pleurodeles waltl TaxID=8319 RepID=A0AAV7W592_PLEWA|nr:hypothetical protein NDU88_003178 [Pleurodeles waltl]